MKGGSFQQPDHGAGGEDLEGVMRPRRRICETRVYLSTDRKEPSK